MASCAEDEEYSDVDFWGGESPRLLSRSPPPQLEQQPELPSEVDESEDESEEEDEDMLDEDEDEGDELDRMDIIGHR